MRIPFHRSSLLFAAGLCAFALSVSASPVSLGQKLKTDGIITGRAGASLALKTQEGNLVVLLTANTDVEEPGHGHTEQPAPGFAWIAVEDGTGAQPTVNFYM